MNRKDFSYLALGDSYTIGESLPLHESFPYQFVQLMRGAGLHFHAPEIVAKTGWASFELAEHLIHTQLNEQYDFVTLLTGVNNQYRHLPMDDFKNDLLYLVTKSIHFTGGQPDQVIMLSIPDWGRTPFAAGKNVQQISKEIDACNEVCAVVAAANHIHFIDITTQSREAANDITLLASDHLHYSAKTHALWANKIAAIIQTLIHK